MTSMQPVPAIPGLTDLVKIGEGGNGVVYRATQTHLRRTVAVKLLTARLDYESAARFAREGHALGIVSGHPGIVPVYSADTTEDGAPYLVMQLCEHGSLADRITRDGPLGYAETLDLGVRMCGALQTAHDAGLLHRDIKPGNILFDSYHLPQLADFGQARLADAELTRTGDVIATPGFAAPEVLTGERASVRSDVYSLATTLAAAMLGYGPFSRASDESVAATLLRVLQEPPPDLRAHGVPDAFAAELERAMDKTPARRPMSAGELGRHLQRIQEGLGLPVTQLIIAAAPRGDGHTAPLGGLAEAPARSSRPPTSSTSSTRAFNPAGRTRGGRWIAIVAALAVLVGAGIWLAFSLIDTRKPTNSDDASALLIGGRDYGPGTWTATSDIGLIDKVFGIFPESQENAGTTYRSEMTSCLGLDPETEVRSSQLSAQYVDASATQSADEGESMIRYRYARSLAMVLDSAQTAERYVTSFASPQFDKCLDDLDGLGVDVGQESELYGATPTIWVPEHEPDMPDGAHFQARQIEIALERGGADESTTEDSGGKTKQQGSRYVTVLAMSAGTSAEYVVIQSDEQELSDKTIDAVAESFLAVATK